ARSRVAYDFVHLTWETHRRLRTGPARFGKVSWNMLTIAVFFFSLWATAAEKGDDRVSDPHASRHCDIYHNGSSGFGGNADNAETADLGVSTICP
ncbi:MAG TPA: hypothetical protein VLL05_20540, partial [Terriglobales bacterium]|nr:hypothetical protein [Terriglobales bacterium]